MHDPAHASTNDEFHFTPFVLTMYGFGLCVGLFVFSLLLFQKTVLAWGAHVWPYFNPF